MKMTVGSFLAQAEVRLAKSGGLSAIADCNENIVHLMHSKPDEEPRSVASKPMLPNQAPEDVASDLLETYADQADPQEIHFARKIYFPISVR